MLKPVVPKFRSDLSVRLGDIAEKQVPAKLKPIVGAACASHIAHFQPCHIQASHLMTCRTGVRLRPQRRQEREGVHLHPRAGPDQEVP